MSLHLNTPRHLYDLNFEGGKVRELWSKEVCLMPFIPSLYAKATVDLFKKFPEVNKFRFSQPENLNDMLTWCEAVRADKNACLWAVLLCDEPDLWDPELPIQTLVGFAGLYAFNSKNRSIECGPIVIFPPFQRMHIGAQAMALLHKYIFTQLNVVCCYVCTHAKNAAAIRLGEKLFFKQELIVRGCSGFGTPDPSPGHCPDDPRSKVGFTSCVCASLFWDEWEKKGFSFAKSINANVSCSAHFRNEREKGGNDVSFTPPIADLRLKPPTDGCESYGDGAAGPALTSSKVVLQPYIAALHGTQLFQLFESHPTAYAEIDFHQATKGLAPVAKTLRGVLDYLARKQTDPSCHIWAILQKPGESSQDSCETEYLIGMAMCQGDTRSPNSSKTCAVIGPLIVIPTPDQHDIQLQVLSLLLQHGFQSDHPLPDQPITTGLGYTRITTLTPPEHPSLSYFEAAGFLREGLMRLAGSFKDHMPSSLRPKASHSLDVCVASITWDEWVAGQALKMRDE